MVINNCKIIFDDRIEEGSVQIKSGKIFKINPTETYGEEIMDVGGLYLSPGFIDIHIHGAGGSDTMDGTPEAIENISKTIVRFGTTSFLPTTMTCSIEDIRRPIQAAADAKKSGTEGAEILGIHLEGPFISPLMTGAQNPDFIQLPSKEILHNLAGDNLSDILQVTLAPEIEGSTELIRYLKSLGITASIGHSKANYAEALKGFEAGISHSTHLFNAMTGFHHREPGIVGAVFDSDITAEVICDGIHICYPSLRTALKVKTPDKAILITDAMMACGMPDGLYSLGGQEVFVKGGSARLKDNTLAGSILTLDKAVRNLYENTNYKLYEIIRMATLNPARHCRVHHKKGLIKEGHDADLVLFDENIEIQKVFVSGIMRFSKE
ncbi:MAG: N-acetylglucosamine-6-phosphate deacetylase [Bacillota bacterium]|nr:N-acetylglucosamine-6-phosphate deacetylase [Bacillota bacterium]